MKGCIKCNGAIFDTMGHALQWHSKDKLSGGYLRLF